MSERPAVTAAPQPPSGRQQWAAVLLAAICAACFLGSALWPGNALLPYPPEMLQPQRGTAIAAGMPASEIFRGNLSMGDKYNQSLAWDRIIQDRLRRGEIPLWTRDIAGGVPFVPQMGQVYHPCNLLLLVLPSTGIHGVWYFLHMVLFGYFAYRFMRRMEIGHEAAMFGMVALILGFWTQARIHHNVMLSAALPVFAMLSCTHHLLRCGGRSGHVALLALGTGLSWISGFAPGSLMCTYLVCGFAVVLAVTNRNGDRLLARQRIAPLLRFGAGIALGLLLASAQLLPILNAAAESSREPASIELLRQKSLEIGHLLTMVWPTLFTWPADHFYPGGRLHNAWPALALLDRELYGAAFNFPETALYAGLAPLCFACGRPRGIGWFFVAAALLGLGMAAGWLLPMSRFVPGAHSGDVKRFLLLFGLCLPVVAAFGLDRMLRSAPQAPTGGRSPRIFAAILGMASLVLLVLHWLPDPQSIQRFYGSLAEQKLGLESGAMAQWIADYPGERDTNIAVLQRGFLIATLVSFGTLVLAWRPRRGLAPILWILTAGELLILGHGTIVTVPIERVDTPPAILQPVLDSVQPNGVRRRLQRLMPPDDADPFRYPAWPNMAAFWRVEDLAAYNPLPKQRMEEFWLALEPDQPGKQSVAIGGAGVGALRSELSLTHPLADLAGIEWILTAQPLELVGSIDRTPAGDRSGYRLYRRTTAMPRATFVTDAVVLADTAERLARLSRRDHDPRATVVLEHADAPRPAGTGSSAEVEIVSHVDEEVRIRVQTATSGYLRLADPWDAGWTATVDGIPTTVFLADHYFRAVFLPPGEHEVLFSYNSHEVYVPQLLSFLAALILLGLGVRAIRNTRTSDS